MARYILPCPCCGGKSEFILQNEHVTINCESIRYGFVVCTECELQQGNILPENEAVKEWNTRKPTDDIVEKLEDIIEPYTPNCNEYNRGVCDAIDIVRNAGKDGAE